MSRRQGFSLVEVLLVIGMVVILIGLLLPAICKVRVTDARSASANRLKQIALAVHDYNDAYQGKLPPLVDIGEGAPTGAGLQSLFFNILPYIEQDNIYCVVNRAAPSTYYSQNTGAAQNIIKAFISPADYLTVPHGTLANVSVTLPNSVRKK
jgi:type II secretory pathway pseudopilin PulG